MVIHKSGRVPGEKSWGGGRGGRVEGDKIRRPPNMHMWPTPHAARMCHPLHPWEIAVSKLAKRREPQACAINGLAYSKLRPHRFNPPTL